MCAPIRKTVQNNRKRPLIIIIFTLMAILQYHDSRREGRGVLHFSVPTLFTIYNNEQ